MLKKVLIGVAAVIVVFVVVVMLQPSTYHVERTVSIGAPAELVWVHISDFSKWQAWNPWQKMDPEQTVTLDGEPGGLGHSSAWDGEKTGKGSMTIKAADAPERLDIELVFVAPMAGEADTGFVIAPKGDAVDVTWTMDGTNDFMGKMFGLFMNMEEMISSNYEQGLADLKAVVEKEAQQEAEAAAAAADLEALKDDEGGAESASADSPESE